jgi:hypothetical protein
VLWVSEVKGFCWGLGEGEGWTVLCDVDIHEMLDTGVYYF